MFKSLGLDLSLIKFALYAVIFQMFKNFVSFCVSERLVVGSYRYLQYVMLLDYCTIAFLCLHSFEREMADVALKEEANKKAFEKFAKESSSNCSVDAVQVSERYES